MTAVPLDIRGLCVDYLGDGGPVRALRGVDLVARAGEIVGIVGESGCGKSTLAAATLALLAANARVSGGQVRIAGTDILAQAEPRRRALRGRAVAMVFQDPATAFNPVLTLGAQLVDYQHHLNLPRAERRGRAVAMLARVGLPDPALAMDRFMHELSGGMRQRAAIAAALLVAPEVLIADEPTTALDVTMEAQILHLLRELRGSHRGAIVVITHHLGVVGEICDRVYVMYAGEVVEEAPVDDLYHRPAHPYTRALIACDPAALSGRRAELPTIPGQPPDLSHPPAGCAFAARCHLATDRCRSLPPPWVTLGAGRAARCHEATP